MKSIPNMIIELYFHVYDDVPYSGKFLLSPILRFSWISGYPQKLDPQNK